MKSHFIIFFLGLTTASIGQSIESIQKRLNLLNNAQKIKYDTTGISKLPKFRFFCTSGIVITNKDSTKIIVPTATENYWKYYSVIDLNNDGLNDLIYSGPCDPYDQTGIFINDGKELRLVYNYPGVIISIEKSELRTTINSLKNACCCDSDFAFTEIVIDKGSLSAKTNRITYGTIPNTNFKDLKQVKVKGILRRSPVQDDLDRKDQCSDQILKGNHWLLVDRATDAIRLDQSGEWMLILYQKNKEESIIGWIKNE